MQNKLLLVLAISFLNVTFAQNKFEKKADKKFQKFYYEEAIKEYIKVDSLSPNSLRNLAEAFRFTNNIEESKSTYETLIALNKHKNEDIFIYAQLLKMLGNYEWSDKWMNKFYEADSSDSRAKSQFLFPDYAKVLMENPQGFEIIHQDINSDAEDFGPAYFENKIVFTSSRALDRMVKRKWSGNKLPFLDIYVADTLPNYKLDEVERYPTQYNQRFHDGPAAFSNDGKLMIFTRNDYKGRSSDGTKNLNLFYAYKTEKGYKNARPFLFNDREYSCGHGSISADGKRVYFASDMPGGFGGVDIYYTELKADSSWSDPVNLGPVINTKGNEMFPFIHETNQLFFASNGHVGLGGLDVFVVSMNNTSKVVNIGHPINTRWDDLGLILNKEQNGGFFSSNREGGMGYDDIYGFKMLEPIISSTHLIGIVVNQFDSIVTNAKVYLKNTDGLVIDSTFSDIKGNFFFDVEPKSTYEFLGMKVNYLDGLTKKTFGNVIQDSVVVVLDQLKIGIDLAKKLKINPIYFDFNKSNIRPDAAVELDKIVKFMNEYPNMEIELGSHTDCRGSISYNFKLSDARAKSSAKYIQERIINPKRIYGKGYGESKLVNHCECENKKVVECTEELHQENRRTEFIIIKM
jgi:outer membrane protein OmpA-like peptidoglycan-associated protein/tetratricopeptide (TPR) repeat protein